MGNWLREQWNQIKGNAKWDVVRWFLAYPLKTLLLTSIPVALAFIAYLRRLPWPVWIFLTLVAQLAIIFVLILFYRTHEKQESSAEKPERASQLNKRGLNLRLIPHGSNNDSLYLEIINQADPVRLSATFRILKVSIGVGLPEDASGNCPTQANRRLEWATGP